MKIINYSLLFHDFFRERIKKLKVQATKLKAALSSEEYKQHEIVKLLTKLYNAVIFIIPSNPMKRDYLLKGKFSKFRRFKQGLGRYRIIFCFSNLTAKILILYVNNEDHLRKENDRNDPYCEFENLLDAGIFSHNPSDPKMQKWIKQERL